MDYDDCRANVQILHVNRFHATRRKHRISTYLNILLKPHMCFKRNRNDFFKNECQCEPSVLPRTSKIHKIITRQNYYKSLSKDTSME